MEKSFILLCIFTLFQYAFEAQGRVIDRTAALVNANVITLSDVEKFRKLIGLRKEIDPFIAFFNLNPKTEKEVVNYLVQETLVTAKFPATKADVDEEVQSILKKNNIDQDALKNILKGQGVTFDVYTNMMSMSISKRKLMDRELRPIAVVTDDEVKNFYYTNPAFIERKKKQKLLLSYDLNQMRIQGKNLANEIAEKLRAGEDFDALSVKYSDRGVKNDSIGVFREDKLSESIRESLEGLRVGDSTKPVDLGSENLFAIHKINSISAPNDPVFEKEKPQIQGMLYQKAMERQLQLWTERERRNAFVHVPE